MPRRKYGKLQKVVEMPPSDNCSRCRSGKHCPIPGHPGYEEGASRQWKGPDLSLIHISEPTRPY